MVQEEVEVEDDSIEALAEASAMHREEFESSSKFIDGLKTYNVRKYDIYGEVTNAEYNNERVRFKVEVGDDEFNTEWFSVGSEQLEKLVRISSAESLEHFLNERIPIYYDGDGWCIDFPKHKFDLLYYRRRLMLQVGLFKQSKEYDEKDAVSLSPESFRAQPTIIGLLASACFWFLMGTHMLSPFVLLDMFSPILSAGLSIISIIMFLKSSMVFLLFCLMLVSFWIKS